MEIRRQKLLVEHLQRRLSPAGLEELWQSNRPAEELAHEWSELDFAFFCRYYLPHYFDKPFAQMHWELAADVEEVIASPEGRAEVLAWPRGFGKSTAICIGLVLWCICWGKKDYTIVIKDSFDQAKLELRGVKDELEFSELLRRDFNNLVGTKWDAAQIITANKVMVEVLGTGMKIRGRRFGAHRPDLIIVDDPESLANVDSPTQRRKTKRYFHRSVMRAGSEKTDVFAIGTKLHTDCLIASLLNAPFFRARLYKSIYQEAERQDLWDEWKLVYLNRADPNRQQTAGAFFEKRRAQMMRGAKVAWPEAFPYYRLQVMRLGEEDEAGGVEIHSFAAEMQNNPIAEEDRLFGVIGFYYVEHQVGEEGMEEWLVPYQFGEAVKLKDCQLYSGCDPSLGATERSDFSAIIDLLVGATGQKFVGQADIKRRLPDKIIADIVEHVRFWGMRGLKYTSFGIESVGFQKLFGTDTAKRMMAEREYLPIEDVPPVGSKYSRIASLQPDFENQYILLLKEQGEPLPVEQRRLYDQLRDFPSAAHNDGPDGLEMANRVAAAGGGVFFA